MNDIVYFWRLNRREKIGLSNVTDPKVLQNLQLTKCHIIVNNEVAIKCGVYANSNKIYFSMIL